MKTRITALLLLSLLAMQACVKDEDKVFDASATERMNAAIQQYKAILCAQPNGWLMEYYPEPDRSLGGYNFICRFGDDGTVAIAGELATTRYPAGDPDTSTFEIIANAGAVLTFNTYNEVLHALTEPRGASDVDGYAGDYEFVFRDVTPAQIIMTGKKYGNTIVLTPYSGGDPATWKAFLAQFPALERKFDAPAYRIAVDGAPAGIVKATRKNRTFLFEYEKPDDNRTVPYIVTATGIKLYAPLTLNGKTAQRFDFNETDETLRSADAEGLVIALDRSIKLKEIFAATTTQWWFATTAMCPALLSAVSAADAAIYAAERERIGGMYIGRGRHSAYTGNSLNFLCTPDGATAYTAIYAFDFVPVPGDADRLELHYTAPQGDGSYPAYLSAFTPIVNLVKSNSPYTLTGNAQAITFTGVADPTFTFTVSL
jgi:hypothetical protein